MLDTGEKKQKSVRWGLPVNSVDETLCSWQRAQVQSQLNPKKKKKKKKCIRQFFSIRKLRTKKKLINAIFKAVLNA